MSGKRARGPAWTECEMLHPQASDEDLEVAGCSTSATITLFRVSYCLTCHGPDDGVRVPLGGSLSNSKQAP